MAQWLKDPVLSLLWPRFDPWLRSLCMLQAQQKNKEGIQFICFFFKTKQNKTLCPAHWSKTTRSDLCGKKADWMGWDRKGQWGAGTLVMGAWVSYGCFFALPRYPLGQPSNRLCLSRLKKGPLSSVPGWLDVLKHKDEHGLLSSYAPVSHSLMVP